MILSGKEFFPPQRWQDKGGDPFNLLLTLSSFHYWTGYCSIAYSAISHCRSCLDIWAWVAVRTRQGISLSLPSEFQEKLTRLYCPRSPPSIAAKLPPGFRWGTRPDVHAMLPFNDNKPVPAFVAVQAGTALGSAEPVLQQGRVHGRWCLLPCRQAQFTDSSSCAVSQGQLQQILYVFEVT